MKNKFLQARQIITDTLSHAFSNLSGWQAIFQLRVGKSVDSTGETRSATKTLITITRPRFEAECGGLAATLVAFHSLFLHPTSAKPLYFPTTDTITYTDTLSPVLVLSRSYYNASFLLSEIDGAGLKFYQTRFNERWIAA